MVFAHDPMGNRLAGPVATALGVAPRWAPSRYARTKQTAFKSGQCGSGCSYATNADGTWYCDCPGTNDVVSSFRRGYTLQGLGAETGTSRAVTLLAGLAAVGGALWVYNKVKGSKPVSGHRRR